MNRALLAAAAVLAIVALPHAAEAGKKKYHFELTAVTPKPAVPAADAATAVARVKEQLQKAWAANEQIVVDLPDAPDKESTVAYRKYLAKQKIAGAYLVTVEITEAAESVELMDSKPKTQRMTVKLAIHMLGENLPGRTIGFTGDGKATIKQELGMKVRDKDREYAWDQASELAIADAMTTVFKQLAIPAKKQ